MRKDSLQKIENDLHHANNVLLIIDGKVKPQKKDISLLEETASKLITVKSTNRSTKNKIDKGLFDFVLAYKNGYFIPHPKYTTI